MSTNTGVYFNGKWIVHPGAYSMIDSSNMSSMSTESDKIVALIGTSTGGTPGKILWFNDPTSAKKALKGGYLLKAAQKAWAPNSGSQGAYTIACIRANQAIQSTLSIGDTTPVSASIGIAKASANSSTATIATSGTYTGTSDVSIILSIDSASSSNLANVTFSWKYSDGAYQAQNVAIPTDGVTTLTLVNGIKLSFGAGQYVKDSVWTITATIAKDSTTVGSIVSADYGALTKKIQVKLEDGTRTGTKMFTTYYSSDAAYEVFDNVGACFYLQYVGSQQYAVLNIAHDSNGNATTLTTKIGQDSTNSIVDLDIDLTDSKVSSIRDLVDYISQYDNYVCSVYAVVNSNVASANLDELSNVSITSQYLACALWKDLEVQLNSNSNYVNFTRNTLISGPPKNFDYTNLTGGSDGTTPSSWLSYFDLLSAYDVNYVVPLTGDDAIIAEAIESVNTASNDLGKERTLKVGGYIGETIAVTQSRALNYNSSRVQLAYPGFYDTDENGETVLYPPFVTAAMFAGQNAYLGIGESATFDYFNVTSLEKNLNASEVNTLIKSGVATLEYVLNKGYRLAQDITTYTTDSVSLYCERSVRDLADSLNKSLRTTIETKVIGKKGTTTNVASVKNLVISFLQQKVRDGVIVAYKGVSVTYSNRVMYIEYSVAPVEPINFALVTGHFYTPDTITG